MSAAKKYQCKIVTGYDMGYDKWHDLKKSDPIVVAATSPNEARIKVIDSGAAQEALAQRPPQHIPPGPNDPDPWPLAVKQITATALKEAKALETMGAPSLFDLSAYDKYANKERPD
jgi:hypothetical protein